MKKWFVGLLLAGGSATLFHLRKKHKKKQSVEFLSSFIGSLESGVTELLTVEDGIKMVNGKKYRVAEFFGKLDSDPFRFVLEQEDMSTIRSYSLYWKDRAILKANVDMLDDLNEDKGFHTIHKILSMIESATAGRPKQ